MSQENRCNGKSDDRLSASGSKLPGGISEDADGKARKTFGPSPREAEREEKRTQIDSRIACKRMLLQRQNAFDGAEEEPQQLMAIR